MNRLKQLLYPLGSAVFALTYEMNGYLLAFVVLIGCLIVLDRSKAKFPKSLIPPVMLFVAIHSRWLLSLMQWEGGAERPHRLCFSCLVGVPLDDRVVVCFLEGSFV